MCHRIFSDIHLEKSDGGQCATSLLVTLKTGLSYSKNLISKKKHFVSSEKAPRHCLKQEHYPA